jgi:uncharacterized damage-inducible protein DinB
VLHIRPFDAEGKPEMRTADVAVLFDYMYWVNRRLLDTAQQLNADEFLASATVTTRNL